MRLMRDIDSGLFFNLRTHMRALEQCRAKLPMPLSITTMLNVACFCGATV